MHLATRHIECIIPLETGPKKDCIWLSAIMALSEFWFGLSAHFYFLVAKTSLRFGMSRLIIVTPAHLTLGFLSGGLLYPKPPTISSKRSSPGKAYLDQRRGLWFRGRSLRCGRVDRPGEDGGHDGQGFATVVVSHSWWTCSVSWRIESGLLVWANGGHQPRHTLRAQPTYRGSNMGAGVKGPGETGWVGRPPYLIGSLFGLSLVRLWTVENDISRPGHGSGTRRKTGPDCRSCSWKGKEDSFFFFYFLCKTRRERDSLAGRGTPNKKAAMFLEYFGEGSLPAQKLPGQVHVHHRRYGYSAGPFTRSSGGNCNGYIQSTKSRKKPKTVKVSRPKRRRKRRVLMHCVKM